MADADRMWDGRRWPGGWRVRHVTETGSTNDDLLAAVEAGTVGDRTALVADHQTAGRGRLDRRWEAPSGANLLVSLLFTDVGPGRRHVEPAHVVQRVGVAVVDAVRTVVSDEQTVGLKWPNDVLLHGAKVAGILAARSAATGAVVVGVGINTSWSPPEAADLGAIVTPADLLERVLDALEHQPADIRPEHRDRLLTLGRRVRVELPGGARLVGRATDIDTRGRLEVTDDAGLTRSLDVGDVVHVRPVGDEDPGAPPPAARTDGV